MSNCIRIPEQRVLLGAGFNRQLLRKLADLDGNAIYEDNGCWWFQPASFTTWRELRTFVRDNLAVAVIATLPLGAKLRGVRDEYDNFESKFTAKLWFNAPSWEYYAR